MIRKWTGPDGVEHEVGDKDAVAEIIGASPRTWLGYVLRGDPQASPAPKPVTVDPKTRRDLWRLDQVRAWHARRPGPGDHGGRGAATRWGKRWGKDA